MIFCFKLSSGTICNYNSFAFGDERDKIIGLITEHLYLEINELPVKCFDAELIQLRLRVADGTMKQMDIYWWITEHTEE